MRPVYAKDISTKVSGSWAVIDGKDVLMAAKVKQGDSFVFKVRLTKDGTPFWSLSPEELAKERAGQLTLRPNRTGTTVSTVS